MWVFAHPRVGVEESEDGDLELGLELLEEEAGRHVRLALARDDDAREPGDTEIRYDGLNQMGRREVSGWL